MKAARCHRRKIHESGGVNLRVLTKICMLVLGRVVLFLMVDSVMVQEGLFGRKVLRMIWLNRGKRAD